MVQFWRLRTDKINFLASKSIMKYKITVETGSLHGAGTNAAISIKLTGTSGKL